MKTQTEEALERANYVRGERAELKRAIAAGRVKAQDILRGELEDWQEGMPIGEVLQAIQGIRRTKAAHLLGQIQVHERRPLRLITHRQRHQLAMLLDKRDESVAQRRAYRERAAA